MNFLISKKVDACILVGSSLVWQTPSENGYIKEAAKKLPIMVLNAHFSCENVYCVLTNDCETVRSITDGMIKSGIKDILYYYNVNSYSGRQKRKGFEEAVVQAGMEDKSRVLFFDGDREDIKGMEEKLSEVYDSGFHFRGVIASEDYLAFSALRFAKSKGFKIPEEFSVVGYNHTFLSEYCEPRLTTVDIHLKAMCGYLTGALVDVLHGKEVSNKVLFSGDFIVGETAKICLP